MHEFLFLYNSENLLIAGIDNPTAELDNDKLVPPPKTIGLFITFVLLIFTDALKPGTISLTKFIEFEYELVAVKSSSGQTISTESCKISLL